MFTLTKVNMVDLSPGTKTENFSIHAVFGCKVSGFDTDCINIEGDISNITYTIDSRSSSGNSYLINFVLPTNSNGAFTILPSTSVQVICDMETTAHIKFNPIEIEYDTRQFVEVIM